MTDTPPSPEKIRKDMARLLVAKAVGLLIALGLSALGIGGLGLVEAGFDKGDAALLATIPDVLVSWREPVDEQFWILLLVLLGPMVLVPGAFGGRGDGASSVWRWRVVALAAATVACGVGLQALVGRPDLGVATPVGLSWLHDGKVREYWSWGAATQVGVGCAEQPNLALNYDVAFPSGREANLAREANPGAADVRRLVARLTPIDASLRARAVPRFSAADETCLRHFGQGLSTAEQVALRELLSR